MDVCQRLVANNDVNGNPRRCWLRFYDDGKLKDVIDEGYGGKPDVCRFEVELPEIKVGVAEYKRFKRQGEIMRGSDVD